VLVLAPHPDDEIFGCGGAIAGHVKAGVPVHVVVLTDGAGFGEVSTRMQESIAAAKVLGYAEPEFWCLPDRGLSYSDGLAQRLANRILEVAADLVYAPSPWEIHPDHRQASLMAKEAVRRAGAPVRLAFYEVGAPLRPNVLVDITDSIEAKSAAMHCFASQLIQQDYARQIGALNQYRSYTLGREVFAVEAYWVLGANELDEAASASLALSVSPGLHAEQTTLVVNQPLVSILIRSMDRAYLAEALDSVALQTYPNIEVVVVAVRPEHSPLSARCGPFALRLLQTDEPLMRSKAANKALLHARGESMLFLDDDDWLMPAHIARLAEVLRHQPHVLAAYTGISLVDAGGKPLGQTFDLPFDDIRQMAGNLTPIHAVLFSAKVLEQGCRFDETLDRYEDWDFWLQLARLTPLVHLPGVSAAYRIHESSGVHQDSGPAGAATAVIYKKWEDNWTPEQKSQIMQRVWSYPELEARLADTGRRLADTGQQLADMQHRLANAKNALVQAQHQMDQLAQTVLMQQQSLEVQSRKMKDAVEQLAQKQLEIAALRSSRSWRFTRPLRWATDSVRKGPIGGLLRLLRFWRR
jgi:LmbE family N-acetylglucosaminyl deacetylase